MYQIVSRYIPTGEMTFGKMFLFEEEAADAAQELNRAYNKSQLPMYATYIKKRN